MNFVMQKAGKEKKIYKLQEKCQNVIVWQFVATRNYCFTPRVNTL